MIVVAIIGVSAGVFVITMSGLRGKNSIDRAAQQVFDDLLYIRSRAVSSAQTHRLRWISDHEWILEYYNSTLSTPAWIQTSTNREMPTNTYLMNGSLSNAGANLESTARGLFQFQNGSTGSPYITIETLGVSKTKSIYVYTGGAIELKTP